jgi:AcrR family transcriptional regulator
MSSESRTYQKRRRAESEAQTRLRITESAVHLHGTLGPARTSMSAVAEHAGVQRSTLYRHFPDEAALFEACSAHWAMANVPPDLSAWAAIRDPDERLRVALGERYGYYERCAPMLGNVLGDVDAVEAVRVPFQAFHAFVAAAADTLMADRRLRGGARRRTRAAIGHAVAFSTWRSLVGEQGLSTADAVELACGFVLSPARCTPSRH